MVPTLDAQSVASSDVNWVPIAVAVITLIGAVIVAIMNTRSDDLKRAERLTGLLEKMKHGPERAFVERIRDDQVVRWTLRASTPKYNTMRIATAYFAVLAVLLLVVSILYIVADGSHATWFWFYITAVVLGFVAAIIWALRRRRQRKWVESERERRSIPAPQNRRLRLEYEHRDGDDDESPVQRVTGLGRRRTE